MISKLKKNSKKNYLKLFMTPEAYLRPSRITTMKLFATINRELFW